MAFFESRRSFSGSVSTFHSSGGSSSTRAAKRAARPRALFSNVADINETNYAGNRVRTTKYTPLNFLFLFIWHQYRSNLSNVFFLAGAIINLIPSVKVYNNFSMWAPIVFVLSVAFVREVAEELRRATADRAVNNAPVALFRDGHVMDGAISQDIRPGDLVLCRRGDSLPADLVIVASSEASGEAYVQTANLDGEANLKLRRAVPLVQSHLNSVRAAVSPPPTAAHDLPPGLTEAVADIHLATTTSQPNAVLDQITGNIICLTDAEVFSFGPDGGMPLSPAGRRKQAARLLASGGMDGTEDPAYFNIPIEVTTVELPGAVPLATELAPSDTARTASPAHSALISEHESLESPHTAAAPTMPHSAVATAAAGTEPPAVTAFADADEDDVSRISEEGDDAEVQTVSLAVSSYLPLADRTTPLEPEQLLLRGCTLHTPWVLGVAVFCGHETKSFLNSATTPNKLSDVTNQLNRRLTGMFVAHFLICLVTSAVGVALTAAEGAGRWYLGKSSTTSLSASELAETFFISTFSFFNIYSCMIPISLFVSIDMARFILARMMEQDVNFFLPGAPPERRFRVATSSLLEELGYVQYVFTDKTGTLTENEMVGDTFWAPDAGAWRTAGQILKAQETAQAAATTTADETAGMADGEVTSDHIDSAGMVLSRAMTSPLECAAGAAPAGTVAPARLMMALALCHTATIDDPQGDDVPAPAAASESATSGGPPAPVSVAQPAYAAESPDEVALVSVAAENGAALLARTSRAMYVVAAASMDGASDFTSHTDSLPSGPVPAGAEVRRARIMAVFPFDSDRKRMSVLIRGPDHFWLLTKGADSMVLPRCTDSPASHRQAALAALDAASNIGLRTLVVAERRIGADVGAAFVVRWRAALGLADAGEKATAMATLMAELEDEHLTILGVTAIEDRLQDGVPETLAFLRRAGVRPWMLTGDKLQTAINIGRSARLIDPRQEIITLTGRDVTSPSDAVRKLGAIGDALGAAAHRASVRDQAARVRGAPDESRSELERVEPHGGWVNYFRQRHAAIAHRHAEIAASLARHRGASNEPHTFESDEDAVAVPIPALVVDGAALTHILEGDSGLFIRVAGAAGAVIVCRASPKQKAECVSLMRDTGKVVAAVGDGANDVSMIQVASVGVGIAGREGLQASRCADFSVSRFRHLQRLLAVHGRHNYQRMCTIIQYSFYKNMAMVTTSILFGFFSDFSGVSAIDSYGLLFYNLMWTAFPIGILTIFDKDIPDRCAEFVPQLYRPLQRRSVLNRRTFTIWLLEAIFSGAVIFAASMICVAGSGGRVSELGRTGGLALLQQVITGSLFAAVTFRVAFLCKVWVWVFTLILVISVMLFFGLQWAASVLGDFGSIGVFHEMMMSGVTSLTLPWWATVVAGALATLPYTALHFAKSRWYPGTGETIVEVFRCRQRLLGIWKLDRSDTLDRRWNDFLHGHPPSARTDADEASKTQI